MKKKLLITVCALGCIIFAKAQEYKVAKSTGRLEIRELNDVSIEGYNGNEIVFSSRNHDRDDDDRAKGLRAISSQGLEDNTGLGISVVDKGDVVEVQQLKKMDGPEIKIMVPKGIKIVFTHTSPHGDDIKLKNMENAIDISTVHNGVYLDNVTGPIQVKTVHGEIEAVFSGEIKNPVTLTSDHGHVDVSIPLSTKANLKLGTMFGEILVDPDLKIDIDRSGSMVKYSDKVNGKLGGGGVEINLSSTHDNVYLRKK